MAGTDVSSPPSFPAQGHAPRQEETARRKGKGRIHRTWHGPSFIQPGVSPRENPPLLSCLSLSVGTFSPSCTSKGFPGAPQGTGEARQPYGRGTGLWCPTPRCVSAGGSKFPRQTLAAASDALRRGRGVPLSPGRSGDTSGALCPSRPGPRRLPSYSRHRAPALPAPQLLGVPRIAQPGFVAP